MCVGGGGGGGVWGRAWWLEEEVGGCEWVCFGLYGCGCVIDIHACTCNIVIYPLC